jgi:hypothetical protein
VPTLAEELLSPHIAQQPGGEFMVGVLEDTLADLEPWIEEQMSTVIHSTYNYLLGESQILNLVISTDQLKETLKDNLKPALMRSVPELASLPPTMIDAAFDEYYQEFSAQIPSTIDISEEMMGPEVMSTLEQAREYINYIQIAYKALIGFMLLLIGLIVLIHRQVRGSTRQLGITFLVYGIPGYVGIFFIKNYAMGYLTQLTVQSGLPASLQAWLPQLVNDILAPMQMFSLGILIGGVVLLVVSFVYKPREAFS